MRLAGALTGKYCTASALASGAQAGAAAATAAGYSIEAKTPRAIDRPYGPVQPLWMVPSPDGNDADDYANHFVDLQRDQSVADILRSTGAGMSSVEHIKRYTSISTGADQGKTSGVPQSVSWPRFWELKISPKLVPRPSARPTRRLVLPP